MSENGDCWKSAASLEQKGTDLRDPKLSIMPSDRLMLITGGSVYDARGTCQTRSPRVAFSKDGYDWTEPRKLLAEDHWLWRVTWQDGWAWGVSKLGEGRDPRRCMLYRSRDAREWEWITEFRLPNNTWNASEATLRFLPGGEIHAGHLQHQGQGHALCEPGGLQLLEALHRAGPGSEGQAGHHTQTEDDLVCAGGGFLSVGHGPLIGRRGP